MRVLWDVLAEDGNRTFEESRALLNERHGVEISLSALPRALKNL